MKQAAMATLSQINYSFQPVPGIESPNSFLNLPDAFNAEEWAIVGESAAIKRLYLQIRRIGPHFRSVLISGEKGTGRQLVARALHKASLSADGPFIVAASGNRIDNLMKAARYGSLFFGDINEMPFDTQDELIEVLRRHEWARDGLAAPQKMITRIIASTKQDLLGLTASGRFRRELCQRIAMVQIALPPLRNRMEDVPLLATHLLGRFAQKYRRHLTITKEAVELLKSHGWPGNVQELKQVLDDAASRSEGGVLDAGEIDLSRTSSEAHEELALVESSFSATRLQNVVHQHVLHVLNSCAGNKLRAAELLGISRSTLYRMLDTCEASLHSSERD